MADEEFRLDQVGSDQLRLLSLEPGDSVENHRESAWIGGCERCQNELTAICAQRGFVPRLRSMSDDIVVVQALVAAGVGVAIIPGYALQAHHRPGVQAIPIPDAIRQLQVASYGDPPDPPATAALIRAIREAVQV